MKKIIVLVENIREELIDAEKYAKLASESKDTDRDLAETYITIAKQELNHAHMEHDQVSKIIAEERNTGKEIPVTMLAVWDWEHGIAIEHEAEVRRLIDVYNG